MAEPLSLQHISQLVCIKTLLDLTHGKDIREYLRLANHSAVMEDLLNHMVRFYPRLLTDDILAGLISPSMQNLRLVNCSKIKPSKFIRIFPHCKKLQGLDLKQCSQMMLPDFFVLIKMAGFHLTSLCVEDCSTVDDEVVQSILRNLHHLRHLNVSSCHNMTDQAFVLDRGQPKSQKPLMDTDDADPQTSYPCSLTSIDVSGCRSLSNTAIQNIARLTGPTLQHVCMSWTRFTLESLLFLSGFDVPRSFLEFEVSSSEKDAGTNCEDKVDNSKKDASESIISETPKFESLCESTNSAKSSHLDIALKPEDCFEHISRNPVPPDLAEGTGTVLNVENSMYLPCASEDSDNVIVAMEKTSENMCINSLTISNISDHLTLLSSQKETKGMCDHNPSCCEKNLNFQNESCPKCPSNESLCISMQRDLEDSQYLKNILNESTPFTKSDVTEKRDQNFPFKENCSTECCYSNNRNSNVTSVEDECSVDQIQFELTNLDMTTNAPKSSKFVNSDSDFALSINHNSPDKSKPSLDLNDLCINNESHWDKESSGSSQGFDTPGKVIANSSLETLSNNRKSHDDNDISAYSDIECKEETHRGISETNSFSAKSDDSSSVAHFLTNSSPTVSDTSPVLHKDSSDETEAVRSKLVPTTEQSAKSNSVEMCDNVKSSFHSVCVDKDTITTTMDSVKAGIDNTDKSSEDLFLCQFSLPETADTSFHQQEDSVHVSIFPENTVDLPQHPEQTTDIACAEPKKNGVDVLQPSEQVVDAFQINEDNVVNSKDVLRNSDGKSQTKSKNERSKTAKKTSPMRMIYKSNIRSIDLEEIYHSNSNQETLEDSLSVFISYNPCLQIFKLSWPKLPNYLLKHLVDTCGDLRELTLVGCTMIDPEHIRYIGTKCMKLQKLELDDIRRLTDWSVAPILSNNDIETLSLNETDIHDVTAVRIAEKLTENLTSLDIAYCQELTENGINSFLRKKSCMTSFCARQVALSDLSLGLMCDNFRQLRSLDIASVKSVTGSGLVTLAKNLRQLESIDLSWTSNSGLQDDVIDAFLLYCPQMNKMKLNGQSRLTSNPFIPIISDYQKWCRCKALFSLKAKERELDATFPPSEDTETDSSDDEYEDLCFPHRSTTFATNLQHLSLEYCDSITDSDMTDIVTVCRGSLAVIDYYSCDVTPSRLRLSKYKRKTPTEPEAES